LLVLGSRNWRQQFSPFLNLQHIVPHSWFPLVLTIHDALIHPRSHLQKWRIVPRPSSHCCSPFHASASPFFRSAPRSAAHACRALSSQGNLRALAAAFRERSTRSGNASGLNPDRSHTVHSSHEAVNILKVGVASELPAYSPLQPAMLGTTVIID